MSNDQRKMTNVYWGNTFEPEKIEKYIENSEDMRDMSFGSEQSVTLVDKKRDGKLLLGLIREWKAIPIPNLTADDLDGEHEIFKLPLYEANSHKIADIMAHIEPLIQEQTAPTIAKKPFTVSRIADNGPTAKQGLVPHRETSIEAKKSATSKRFSIKSSNPIKVSVPSHYVKPANTKSRKSVMDTSKSRNPDKSRAGIREASRSKSRVSRGSNAFKINTLTNISRDFGTTLGNPYKKEAVHMQSHNVLDVKETQGNTTNIAKQEHAPYCNHQ